jgi:hypothetical protein
LKYWVQGRKEKPHDGGQKNKKKENSKPRSVIGEASRFRNMRRGWAVSPSADKKHEHSILSLEASAPRMRMEKTNKRSQTLALKKSSAHDTGRNRKPSSACLQDTLQWFVET